MNQRMVEFFLVLVAAAVVAAFLLREKAEEPYVLAESPRPVAMGTPEASPLPFGETVMYTPIVREDYEKARGQLGFEEALKTPILAPSQARIERGAKSYQANCALCHGKAGNGDGLQDNDYVYDPPPTDLTRPDGYKYGHRELAIFRTSKFGVEGTAMAPWDGILSDEELWCITHYVMFLQEEK